MNSTTAELWPFIQSVKHTTPVVHNITNFVVMHTTANALLAFGASPIMAHEEEEVEHIVSIASALVVNIGTLSKPWIRSMEKAILQANKKNIPIVLDPVGAGASPLRTETAISLAHLANNLSIRGNASEVMAMAGITGVSKGVDSAVVNDAQNAVAHANKVGSEVATRFQATVCISGEVDTITDGKSSLVLHGGSALMPKVTGMGCTSSALAGAILGANTQETSLLSLAATMAAMSTAGSIAEKVAYGPGSFLPAFLDALYLIKEEDLATHTVLTAI